MIDDNETVLDVRLREIFAAERVSMDDDTFVAQVMRRVERRVAIRRAVLGGAASLGIAIAAVPLAEVATSLGVWITGQAAEIRALDAADLSSSVSVAILLAALCVGAARSLAR